MPGSFVNLNPRSGPLPATLAVPWDGDLYRARVLHADSDHYIPPSARRPALFDHDHYHIILVTQNEGMFNLNGDEVPARAGDVFFTSPLVRHNFSNVGTARAHYAEITFEFVNASNRPLRLPFGRLLQQWTNQPCREVMRLRGCNALVRSLRGQIAAVVSLGARGRAVSDLELNAFLSSLLLLAYEHGFRAAEVRPPDRLDAVRDYVQSHYRTELTLASLASRAGVSPNYLSRRFKELYGRTPIDLQIDLRIRDACTRLRTSDQKLVSIAREVGFDDVFYFGRLFRKRMGVSPGRYRRGAGVATSHAEAELTASPVRRD